MSAISPPPCCPASPPFTSTMSRLATRPDVALLAAACATGVAPASAQSRSGLDLRWEAPAGCPQENEVRHRIRSLAPAFESPDLHLQAEGTMTRNEGRYRMRLV